MSDMSGALSAEPSQNVEEKHAQDVFFLHVLRMFHVIGPRGRPAPPLVASGRVVIV